MIRHTVAFRLVHAPGSPEEEDFLRAAPRLLSAIPGALDFVVSRQVSPKSSYRFQFAMSFATAETYARYDEHPDHRRFVATRWASEVAEFAELDLTTYP